jgi:lysophospholipase L1-like esterase
VLLAARRRKAHAAEAPKKGDGLQWADARQWPIEGKGWTETERVFDRLPAKAKASVRKAVWNLSRHSAGMAVRFETDARAIAVRWSLLSRSLAMNHMAATGVSGVDLYAQDDAGTWRWLAVGRPSRQKNQATLARGLPAGQRAYTLYLPLYNGTESLEIGVAADAEIRPLPPRETKPLVFYGTSITHGACASRPGMCHPAILGRRLDREVINLGFSGNGTMDAAVGELMAELDAGVYVIDCLPNMTADAVAQRTEPLVRILRKARPNVPIVLVEDRSYADAWLVPGKRRRNETSRAALKKAYQNLLDAGLSGLHYVPGDGLLGEDNEATVDSSHPSDLGFMRMADALEPVLRAAM